MHFCYECGSPLVLRECGDEGMVQYCETCKAFRFPIFSTAISTVVFTPDMERLLLIQQYGRTWNVLVAGYVTKGEAAEDTVIREVKEEIGLNIVKREFVKSEYFPGSNTLMLNFMSVADSDDLSGMNTQEVDKATWYTPEEALKAVAQPSLAQRFLIANLQRLGKI